MVLKSHTNYTHPIRRDELMEIFNYIGKSEAIFFIICDSIKMGGGGRTDHFDILNNTPNWISRF